MSVFDGENRRADTTAKCKIRFKENNWKMCAKRVMSVFDGENEWIKHLKTKKKIKCAQRVMSVFDGENRRAENHGKSKK